jgi:hypothetical protein
MSALNRAATLLGVAALMAIGAFGQAKSGLYDNLTLGVDGTTVTGVFSDARVGNGTEDAPQFSCLFLLRGTLDESAAKVTVWLPLKRPTTSGTMTFEKDSVKLHLDGDPPGCAATGDEFASEAYEETSLMNCKWTSVRLVSAEKQMYGRRRWTAVPGRHG